MYFLPAGLKFDANVFVVYKTEAFTSSLINKVKTYHDVMSRQHVKSTTCKNLIFLSEAASSPNVKIYFRFIRTSQLKLSYPRAQINLFAVKIVCSVEFSLNFENDRNHSRECFTEIWNLSIFNFIRDNISDFAFRYTDLCFIFVSKGTFEKN